MAMLSTEVEHSQLTAEESCLTQTFTAYVTLPQVQIHDVIMKYLQPHRVITIRYTNGGVGVAHNLGNP